MANVTDTRPTDTTTPSTAPTWIGGAGLVLVAIGLLAAVVMWSDMGDGFDYTATDKWLAVLTALIVSGLGLVALAISAVLARMQDR